MKMAPSSAAIALRESFGDRKIPDITRKITACVACRKLKIKCHMNGSKPPCTRCKNRGLPCTVNKSIQMLLENDVEWKDAMEQRIEKIEEALFSAPSTDQSFSWDDLDFSNILQPEGQNNACTPSMSTFHDHPEVSLDMSVSLGAFPASSLKKSTQSSEAVNVKPDLISLGIISKESAEQHFTFYKDNLDPYAHHILGPTRSLDDIRTKPSLLIAAVCTTAAFCAGTNDYQSCFDAFVKEVSEKTFSVQYSFDDVRALCIGALWLNEISSALNALAVRIAMELNLHRCVTKMPHTKEACYERTRLYFIVYVCDHHSCLSHGRRPMTHEPRLLRTSRALLQSKFSTHPSDLTLIAHVELWSISAQVLDTFGADIENSLISDKSAELDRLSGFYDRWHTGWSEILTQRLGPDDPSLAVLDLYFHSAKLYLFSHVFRGPRDSKRTNYPSIATGMHPQAKHAVRSALAVIRGVADDDHDDPTTASAPDPAPALRSLNLPAYFWTTTAFSAVLLLQAIRHRLCSAAHQDDALQALHALVASSQTSFAAIPSRPHPLRSIAESLGAAMGNEAGDGRSPRHLRDRDMSPDDFISLEQIQGGNFENLFADPRGQDFSGVLGHV